MTPSIDLRIATMLRAMEDVVTPALDMNNSLAREQAALVIGHLKLLAEQWKRAEGYAKSCLADLVQCLEALKPVGGSATQEAFTSLVNTIADVNGMSAEDRFKSAMAGADKLIRATDVDGDGSFRKVLHANLLAFSKRQSLRDRSWFALSGFDLKPHELHSIDDIIEGHIH